MNAKLANLIYRCVAKLRGENTFGILNDYRKSQYWSIEKLDAYQKEKIQNLVGYATREIPFFQKLQDNDFSSLPIIEKEWIQKDAKLFQPERLVGKITKKTTGAQQAPQ